MRMGLAAAACVWASLVQGCAPTSSTDSSSTSSSSGGGADAGLIPEQATPVTPGAVLSLATDVITSTAVQTAHQLPTGEVLFSTETGVLRVLPGDTALPVQGNAGAVLAVAMLGQDVLLAGVQGMFLVDGHVLTASPLGNALVAADVRALLPSGDALWIVSVDGLRLYRNGALRSVTLGEVDVATAVFSVGGDFDGLPALWVLHAGKVLAVQPTDSGVNAWQVRQDLLPTAMAADGSGGLWLVDGGDLHHQRGDGGWEWLRLPSAVTAVRADAWSGDVWVTSQNGMFLYAEGGFRPVTLPPGEVLPCTLGRLLVKDTGLTQIRGRRLVSISGLPVGGVVEVPVTLTVVAEEAAGVAAVAATVGDVVLEVSDTNTIALSPALLGEGEHVLDIRATYMDGALPTRTVRQFFVQNVTIPTWAEDIEEIFMQHCNRCHGDIPGATAHRMNTKALWQAEITDILSVVRSGAMPLGADALGQADVDRIAEWANADFPE